MRGLPGLPHRPHLRVLLRVCGLGGVLVSHVCHRHVQISRCGILRRDEPAAPTSLEASSASELLSPGRGLTTRDRVHRVVFSRFSDFSDGFSVSRFSDEWNGQLTRREMQLSFTRLVTMN